MTSTNARLSMSAPPLKKRHLSTSSAGNNVYNHLAISPQPCEHKFVSSGSDCSENSASSETSSSSSRMVPPTKISPDLLDYHDSRCRMAARRHPAGVLPYISDLAMHSSAPSQSMMQSSDHYYSGAVPPSPSMTQQRRRIGGPRSAAVGVIENDGPAADGLRDLTARADEAHARAAEAREAYRRAKQGVAQDFLTTSQTSRAPLSSTHRSAYADTRSACGGSYVSPHSQDFHPRHSSQHLMHGVEDTRFSQNCDDTRFSHGGDAMEDLAFDLEEVRRMRELRKLNEIIRKATKAKMSLLRAGSKRGRNSFEMGGIMSSNMAPVPNHDEYLMNLQRPSSSSPLSYEDELNNSSHSHSPSMVMMHHDEPIHKRMRINHVDLTAPAPSAPSAPSAHPAPTAHLTPLSAYPAVKYPILDPAVSKAVAKKQPTAIESLRRPLTAYNFFFITERKRILKSFDEGGDGSDVNVYRVVPANPLETYREVMDSLKSPEEKKKRRHRKGHGKIEFSELSKLVGVNWRNLSVEAKQHYKVCADMDLKRHREDKKRLTEVQ